MRRLLTAALLALAFPAAAQEAGEAGGWQVTLGTGALYSPGYEGDDDYTLMVLPNVQVRYQDRFFASVQEGAGYHLLRAGNVTAGPIGRLRFSRKEDGDQTFTIAGSRTSDLLGLGDVGTSIELGGFLRYEAGPFAAGAELRQAVSGHDGLVMDLNANIRGRINSGGPPVIWSLGPRLRIVDDTYNSAYFGVTPVQSLASGLPQFEAGSGVYSYGAGAFALVPLDRQGRWSVAAFAGYDRLTGDAGDAPLVRLRGSPGQFSAGLFLSRTSR
jgi:outer membrane protein